MSERWSKPGWSRGIDSDKEAGYEGGAVVTNTRTPYGISMRTSHDQDQDQDQNDVDQVWKYKDDEGGEAMDGAARILRPRDGRIL